MSITRADATEALATEPAMTALARILRDRHHAGRHWVAVDDITDELDAAGITGNAVGCLFRAAYIRGWLGETEQMHTSSNPSARGRRIPVWVIASWRLPKEKA